MSVCVCVCVCPSQLERLQTLLDQEKQTNQDMESLGEDLLKDKQKLEKVMEGLQADKDKQVRPPSCQLHMT